MIRVLVADDQAAVRGGFAALIRAQEDMEVVGEAADGRQAVDLARRLLPHVVLMDVRMPVLDGIAATRELKAQNPATRVILLTAYEEDDLRTAALAAGADEFVLKGISGQDLAALIRRQEPCEAA